MRTAAVWIVLAACGHTSNGVLPDGSGGSNHDVHVDGAIDASPVCGKRGGMRGKTNRMVNAGGLDRTYIVYLPDVSPTEAVPLVFVHHGYTMSGQNMYDITGYTALADREHVAVAFPDGQGGPGSLGAPWNVGANVCTSYEVVPPDAPGDDFAFLDAMKADIEQDQCLDTAHTFVTGFSMGGYFSHHVACVLELIERPQTPRSSDERFSRLRRTAQRVRGGGGPDHDAPFVHRCRQARSVRTEDPEPVPGRPPRHPHRIQLPRT